MHPLMFQLSAHDELNSDAKNDFFLEVVVVDALRLWLSSSEGYINIYCFEVVKTNTHRSSAYFALQ